jgi:hypothetical protein
MGRIAMLFWSIWHHRNNVVWNDNPSLLNQVRRIAYDAWNDWFVIHHSKNEGDYDSAPPTSGRWEKPRIGWVKYNVDVAFFMEARATTM